jgi:hypothetical protein
MRRCRILPAEVIRLARIVNRPIAVTLGYVQGWPGLAPIVFVYLRERHQVREILDYWTEEGRWREQEEPSETWRVLTVKGGVFELMHTPATRAWVLYKVYD